METKRCAYCHKLLRADTQVCSRCGHAFVRKKARLSMQEWTRPSIPPASPHRAGHYSGLHPEDQPYQSNKIAVQYPTLQESENWRASLPDPEYIILPDTNPALRRRVNIPEYYDERSAEELSAIEEPFFSKPDKWLLPRRAIPILLTISCIFFLLASSLIAMVLIRKSTSMPGARITTREERSSPISSVFIVSPSTLSFPIVVREQEPVLKAIILQNSSNQPLNWSATVSTTDQGHWLSAEPSSGTLGAGVEGYMNAGVNAQGLKPGSYRGMLMLSPGSAGALQQVTILLTVS